MGKDRANGRPQGGKLENRFPCPQCGSHDTTIDFLAVGNLWRLPLTLLLAVLVGPIVRIWFKCRNCQKRYTAYGMARLSK